LTINPKPHKHLLKLLVALTLDPKPHKHLLKLLVALTLNPKPHKHLLKLLVALTLNPKPHKPLLKLLVAFFVFRAHGSTQVLGNSLCGSKHSLRVVPRPILDLPALVYPHLVEFSGIPWFEV